MHELSIAVSLVDLACEEMERRQLDRILALHLRVGAMSGVVKDALVFSFGIAAAGTSVEGTSLNVEDTPGRELELFAMEIAE